LKLQATRIRHRVNVNELTQHAAEHLEMNEIALVEFEASQPLYFDAYEQNRTTGSLILIDPISNATVGAVLIREELPTGPGTTEPLEAETNGRVVQAERIQRRGHDPALFVITGERWLAEKVERELFQKGFETVLLHRSAIPASSRRSHLLTLWDLGLVIISWAETAIRLRDKRLLADIACDSLFELHSVEGEPDGEIDWDEFRRISESLRTDTSHISGGGI
jgi:hypothetical protein